MGVAGLIIVVTGIARIKDYIWKYVSMVMDLEPDDLTRNGSIMRLIEMEDIRMLRATTITSMILATYHGARQIISGGFLLVRDNGSIGSSF
jgi:hypothetical protein